MSKVRVRFAPSPTGHLHIGGLRTALFNWLFARHNNGQFLLRIEDTDLERSKDEYTQAILDAFKWVDILPDEPIVIQSSRIKEHQRVIEKLLKEGKVYKCYCSQDEVKDRAEDEAFIKYDGTCRNRTDHPNKPYAIRFKLPEVPVIEFDDMIRGPIRFERDQLDDFIIARSDGTPMYNFVVVVDDAFMGITHVIRGEDHISNTPKQILLYQACGYAIPRFAHIPMILGPSGDRLSKRDGATSVIEYQRLGYLPDALLNYLARLGWAHGDQEIFSRQEMIDFFTLEAVGKKGSIFDKEKLDWVNSVYIKNISSKQLLDYLIAFIDNGLMARLKRWDTAQICTAIDLYKERVATVVALRDDLILLHDGPVTYSDADRAQWISGETAAHLEKIAGGLVPLQDFNRVAIDPILKQMVKEMGIKFVTIAQPLRIALLGKSSGPGILEMLEIVGKDETIARIKRLQKLA